jgi:hypothetical protein
MCTGLEILMIGSTALSAVNQINQGNQQKEFADYQAAQADADAQAEREMGQVRADKVRKAGRAQQSEARAALAAGGMEVGAGTALTIDEKIALSAEEDALQEILYGSRKGARLNQEAQGSRAAGRNARAAGYAGAAGSVLSAGARFYGPGWRTPVGPQQAPAPVEDRIPSMIR